MTTELENAVATPEVKKPVVKTAKASPKAKVTPKVTNVTSEKTNEVTKAIKAEAKKVVNTAKKVNTEIKKDTQKVVENVKDMVEDSAVSKIVETGKKTTRILTTAGEKLFNNSVKSTKAIAAIYTKAGIYSRSHNNLTTVVDGVSTTKDIVNLTLTELKLSDANGVIIVYVRD